MARFIGVFQPNHFSLSLFILFSSYTMVNQRTVQDKTDTGTTAGSSAQREGEPCTENGKKVNGNRKAANGER